ncbi:MAG: hypothetical protein KJ927_03320, partial [Candidatus Eisenbacteria bacterium]|nr:hypothetical protein [Candidatus Eisenbacteria bacterium]
SGGAGSYQTAYLQLEVSYEPIRHGWFNATTRWGRRDYTEASSSQIIVFEGYNLSLARSDYTFASLSLLGDVELGWGLSIEGFLQYDLEWHDSADDDFKLSTLTLRIARDL